MFQKSSLRYLSDLNKHNQKDWFDNNRSRYDDTKQDLEKFTADQIKRVSQFDESIAHLQVKECLVRINRDIRFSKDKTPYKTHLSMYLSRGGRKGIYPGYYFHLEPGKSRVSGGLWMPMPPELRKVRQEIDYNWEEFRKISDNKKFTTAFGGFDRREEYLLTRPPKGYDENNPAIEYLKLKSWIVSAPLSDEDILSRNLSKNISAYYKLMNPLILFLTRALEE